MVMATINMHDAKTQLSDLVARAEAGEEIVIARRNKPAVRLVPMQADSKAGIREARKRVPGRFAHLRSTMRESDWFAPLPEDELQAWEGKYSNDQDKPAR
jgi:prevent-host-death family protein